MIKLAHYKGGNQLCQVIMKKINAQYVANRHSYTLETQEKTNFAKRTEQWQTKDLLNNVPTAENGTKQTKPAIVNKKSNPNPKNKKMN